MLGKEASLTPFPCPEEKVSKRTLYDWRKHFGGLAPVDVKRVNSLETENDRL
jgi:putative transposase